MYSPSAVPTQSREVTSPANQAQTSQEGTPGPPGPKKPSESSTKKRRESWTSTGPNLVHCIRGLGEFLIPTWYLWQLSINQNLFLPTPVHIHSRKLRTVDLFKNLTVGLGIEVSGKKLA